MILNQKNDVHKFQLRKYIEDIAWLDRLIDWSLSSPTYFKECQRGHRHPRESQFQRHYSDILTAKPASDLDPDNDYEMQENLR